MKLFYLLLCSILFSLSISSQLNLNDSLVAYYPFNGNANDSTQFGNHAINIYGAVPDTGYDQKLSGSYYFDGIDDYIEISNAEQINFSGDQTYAIALWIKAAKEQSCLEGSRIFTKWNGALYDSYPYRLSLNSQKHIREGYLGYGQYASQTNNYDPEYKIVLSTSQINDNKWHHIVLQQTEKELMQIFVDGKIEGNVVYPFNRNLSNDLNLFIGANDPRLHNTASRAYTGNIDELRIYNRSLSSDEIKFLAANDSIYPIIDTIIVYETIPVYDTIPLFDTIPAYDTLILYDTVQITLPVQLVVSNVIVTGFENALEEGHISLYPNPVNQYFFIKHDLYNINDVRIYNLEGKKIFEEYFDSREVKIDINVLDGKGVYILQIKAAGKEITLQISVQ